MLHKRVFEDKTVKVLAGKIPGLSDEGWGFFLGPSLLPLPIDFRQQVGQHDLIQRRELRRVP